MKHGKSILVIIFFLFLVCIQSIAYSAFSSTINITGFAHSRVDADVRITKFKVYNTSNDAVSLYEEFSKNTIASNIELPTDTSSITYEIEITNYGTNSIGISDIIGLQSNLTYELIDYNLKEKLCNDDGKCNNYATKVFYIKITGLQGTYDINLTLDFKPFLTITYTNITNNNYPTEIFYNDNLIVTIGNDNAPGVSVTSGGISTKNYKYIEGTLTINNVVDNIEITKITHISTYNFTGNYQTFTTPYTGMYKIELWGAQGGPSLQNIDPGGLGAYVSGNIQLNDSTNLYVYIGNYGHEPSNLANPFNGGGMPDITGQFPESHSGLYSGGGATDVRLVSGEWDNIESLRSRIMVAAGGGGGNNSDGTSGGAGGGLSGITPHAEVSIPTQTSGYAFGKGQGSGVYPNDLGADTGAGGGGYYGGYRGISTNCGGSGGSSFISGHSGCNALNSSGTHTGQSIHYSNYSFTNTKMIDGDGYIWTTSKGSKTGMPTHDGTSTMVGNAENGYAKITLIKMIKE